MAENNPVAAVQRAKATRGGFDDATLGEVRRDETTG